MSVCKGIIMQTKKPPTDEMESHALQDAAPISSVDESRRRFTKGSLAVSGVLLTLASRPSLGGGQFGGGGECKSPSGFLSGNLSHHGGHPGGGGHSCQYWVDHCASWGSCDPSKEFCKEFNFDHHESSNYGCKVSYDFSDSHGTKYNEDSRGAYVPYTLLDMLCRYHVGYKPSGSRSDCDIKKDPYGRAVNTYYSTRSCGNITSYKHIDENSSLDQLGQYCVAALLNCRGGYTPFLLESTVKEMYNACRTGGKFHPTAGVDWDTSKCIEYLKSTQDCTYYS